MIAVGMLMSECHGTFSKLSSWLTATEQLCVDREPQALRWAWHSRRFFVATE
jgi:hypothetical protein